MAKGKGFETRLHADHGLGGEIIIGEKYQGMILNYTVLVESTPSVQVALPLGMTDAIELDSLVKFLSKAAERNFDSVVRGETTMTIPPGQLPYFTFHRLGGAQLALALEEDFEMLRQELKAFILQGEQSNYQIQLIDKYRDYNNLGYKL
ncbi:MAG: hypothetical protein PHT78_03360 [Desulfitobacteriaceae bacterium]|nr:hypothetical protein [Desulfitobacteriaceae bacterium]MDD4752280.1 hypothetical protein [Desulfitobacteriaceae bacterium]